MSVVDRVTEMLESGKAFDPVDFTETEADDIRCCLAAYRDLPPAFRRLIDALNTAAASGIITREILTLTSTADQLLRKTERTYG